MGRAGCLGGCNPAPLKGGFLCAVFTERLTPTIRRSSDIPALSGPPADNAAKGACAIADSVGREGLQWVVCHEHRREYRRCATVREMKEDPSSSVIRSRSQATASCCGQKPWW